jgi:multiple sugar transport system ATP-binding protein
MLGVEHLLERRIRQLSGGERQRVALGRAIVRRARLFLMDEPLSNLDAQLRIQMRREIIRLQRQLGITTIYVTHDQVEAMTLADRIVVLNGGEVEQFGSPLDLYHQPQNLFVAGFIGSPKMNLLPGEIAAGTDNALTVRLADGSMVLAPAGDARPGDKVTLGMRPEHLLAGGGGDAEIRGQVVAVEHLGGETYIYLEHGGAEPLVVKAGGDASAKVDEMLPIGVPAAACYLFDDSGQAFARPG